MNASDDVGGDTGDVDDSGAVSAALAMATNDDVISWSQFDVVDIQSMSAALPFSVDHFHDTSLWTTAALSVSRVISVVLRAGNVTRKRPLSKNSMPATRRRTRHDALSWTTLTPSMSRMNTTIARADQITTRRPLSEILMPAALRKVAIS